MSSEIDFFSIVPVWWLLGGARVKIRRKYATIEETSVKNRWDIGNKLVKPRGASRRLPRRALQNGGRQGGWVECVRWAVEPSWTHMQGGGLGRASRHDGWSWTGLRQIPKRVRERPHANCLNRIGDIRNETPKMFFHFRSVASTLIISAQYDRVLNGSVSHKTALPFRLLLESRSIRGSYVPS